MAFSAEFSVDEIDKKTGFPSLESALHFLPAVLALTQYLSEQNVFENEKRLFSLCVDLYHTVNKYVARCMDESEPSFKDRGTYLFADVASTVAGLNAKLLELQVVMGEYPSHRTELDLLAGTIFGFVQEVAGSISLKGEGAVNARARAACNAFLADGDKNPLALVGLQVLAQVAAKKFKAYTHTESRTDTLGPLPIPLSLRAIQEAILIQAAANFSGDAAP